jgi:hypothetical protein
VEARRRAAPISDAIRTKVASEDAAGVAAELRKALAHRGRAAGEAGRAQAARGDVAIVGRYVHLIAGQRMRIRSLVEALAAEDISTIEVVVAELREATRRAKRLADRYGFTKCDLGPLPAP